MIKFIITKNLRKIWVINHEPSYQCKNKKKHLLQIKGRHDINQINKRKIYKNDRESSLLKNHDDGKKLVAEDKSLIEN